MCCHWFEGHAFNGSATCTICAHDANDSQDDLEADQPAELPSDGCRVGDVISAIVLQSKIKEFELDTSYETYDLERSLDATLRKLCKDEGSATLQEFSAVSDEDTDATLVTTMTDDLSLLYCY